MDSRLWRPGFYRVRAVLAPEVTPDGTFDPATALVSNEETLNVSLPSEDDAAVWSWMREQKWSESAWSMRPWQLANFVLKYHPKSLYALYTAMYVKKAAEGPSPAVIDAVRRYPNKPFTDQLKLLLDQEYEQAQSLARQQANFEQAAYESDRARAMASDLAKNSRSANVRAYARELLDRIPSREQLRRKPQVH